jgi:hypothetical protein
MKFLVRSKISPENLGLLFGLLGGIIFGATLPMTRLPVTDLDPYWLTAGRAAGAGVLASAVLIGLRRPLPSLAQFRRIGIAALMLVMGFPGFSGIAMKTMPAAHAGVVVGIADGDGRGGGSGGRAAQHRILDLLQFLRGHPLCPAARRRPVRMGRWAAAWRRRQCPPSDTRFLGNSRATCPAGR